jgi:hypothetical protein
MLERFSLDPILLGSIYALRTVLRRVLTEERKMDDHPSSATVNTACAALAEVFIDTETPRPLAGELAGGLAFG